MEGLFAVVNEAQQNEVLEMLSDFKVLNLAEYKKEFNVDYFIYPLFINFIEKTIRRLTSITCLAEISKAGHIVRDYAVVKATIEEYLHEQSTNNTL